MLLLAELLTQEVAVDLTLAAEVDEQEEEVQGEDEGQQPIEDHGETDQVGLLSVLPCKVHQTQEHKHLHPLSDVEMQPNVLALVGFAVNCQREVGSMHCRHSHDGVEGLLVKDCEHQCEKGLLEAAEKPEILSNAFVVGAYEIEGWREGVVPHPLGLHHFLPRLQEKEDQYNQLESEEDC